MSNPKAAGSIPSRRTTEKPGQTVKTLSDLFCFYTSCAQAAHSQCTKPPKTPEISYRQMANASARLTAHMLEEMGYSVEFGFPGLKSVAEEESLDNKAE